MILFAVIAYILTSAGHTSTRDAQYIATEPEMARLPKAPRSQLAMIYVNLGEHDRAGEFLV